MPARLNRACRHRGCPDTTTHRSGYCDQHKKTDAGWGPWQKLKGSTNQRGYGSEWRTLRTLILERDHHLCQACLKQGVLKPGNQVDHIIPKARQGTDESSNLQTLCERCHRHKTATEKHLLK